MIERRGFVCSDLHIFSVVSEWQRYLPDIEAAAGRASVVVFNGDTFEFKRVRFASRAETIIAAVRWLESLLERHTHTRFEYILGNHDSGPDFLESLRGVESRHSNLRVSEDVLVVGRNLFLHGDVCDSGPTTAALHNLRAAYSRLSRDTLSIVFAELITRTRLNAVEYLRRRPERLCPLIVSYLDCVKPGFSTLVDTVYFGHTHVPFTGYRHAGLEFCNTGGAVRGLRCAPLWFDPGSEPAT